MMDTFSCNSFEPNQPHDDDDHQEESGWTTYLDDFSNQYRTRSQASDHDQDKSSCSLSGVSPSLISDAANDKNIPVIFPAQLKFRKARTKRICEDDSLEDTASSPVNSPKVSDQFERIQAPPRKIEDFVSSSFVMGNIGGMKNDNQIQISEGDEQRMTMVRNFREDNNNNNSNNNNMDLRSRGLCVVPVSMLANFNSRF